MKTIAILGANGQVGSEVCLFLSLDSTVRVVPICRTHYGASYLRRCGLECRIGVLDRPDDARRLLEGCDLVADFSLPKGMACECRAATRAIVSSAIEHSAPKTMFVYVSSEMAWGMHYEKLAFRNHLFSHTTYGAMKRDGEQHAFRLGRSCGKDVYILRLGQVHGELQSVSRNILRDLRDVPTTIPTTAFDVVFAFSVAEALGNIANGKERPGLYSMVSTPPWSWAEIHRYYARRIGIAPPIRVERDRQPPSVWQEFKAFARRCTVEPCVEFARHHRELLSGYLLVHFPKWERRLKAIYSQGNARREIEALRVRAEYRPFDPIIGDVPGKRLQSLSDSRLTMDAEARKVRNFIDRVCPQTR